MERLKTKRVTSMLASMVTENVTTLIFIFRKLRKFVIPAGWTRRADRFFYYDNCLTRGIAQWMYSFRDYWRASSIILDNMCVDYDTLVLFRCRRITLRNVLIFNVREPTSFDLFGFQVLCREETLRFKRGNRTKNFGSLLTMVNKNCRVLSPQEQKTLLTNFLPRLTTKMQIWKQLDMIVKK